MKVLNTFSILKEKIEFINNSLGKALIKKADSVDFMERMQVNQLTTLVGLNNCSENNDLEDKIVEYCDGSYSKAKEAINLLTSGNPAKNGIGIDKKTNSHKSYATPLAKAYTNEAYASNGTAPCLLYTSPSPRDRQKSRMPSSA